MPNYITSLKLFKHLSRDMLNDTKYDWPLYSERVCLSHKSRPSKSRFFLQSAESIRGGIIYSFAFRWKTRIGHHFCPFPHLTRSHTCARARKGIFTIGFYTHCSRFMSRLFLWPLKAKEWSRPRNSPSISLPAFASCRGFPVRKLSIWCIIQCFISWLKSHK